MVKVGLVVPVLYNMEGALGMFESVDYAVQPFIQPNYIDNIGVSASWNKGIYSAERARCDVVLVVNDDIMFVKGTIFKLVTAVWNHGFDLATAINVRDFGPHGGINEDEPDFSCFAVQPQAFRAKHGYFDEGFSPAYFEDNDMHYRLKLAGAKVGRLNDAPIFHEGSVTQFWQGGRVVSHEKFRDNERYYSQKWGGTPGNEMFNTPFGQPNLRIKDW